jgi:predicted metal-binding protein
MLPAVSDDTAVMSEEKINFVANLTKCFSDCAAILVIDHRRLVSDSIAVSYVTALTCRTGPPSLGRLAKCPGLVWVMIEVVFKSACISCST